MNPLKYNTFNFLACISYNPHTSDWMKEIDDCFEKKRSAMLFIKTFDVAYLQKKISVSQFHDMFAIVQYTEVRLTSFLFDRVTTMALINPPERQNAPLCSSLNTENKQRTKYRDMNELGINVRKLLLSNIWGAVLNWTCDSEILALSLQILPGLQLQFFQA